MVGLVQKMIQLTSDILIKRDKENSIDQNVRMTKIIFISAISK